MVPFPFHVTLLKVGFPSTFITMEPMKPTLAGVIDKTRPMDNMPLTFEAPQEVGGVNTSKTITTHYANTMAHLITGVSQTYI